tara:strand:- start:114 stop:563 length:450 start_codon:yes stop_codon:yes gene_type:complete
MSMIVNEDEFPHVRVYLVTASDGTNDVQGLLNLWRQKYLTKQDFSFCFHTEKLVFPKLSDIRDLANFIKEQKKLPYQYLQYSIIIISSRIIRSAVKMLFSITKPMSTVFLVKSDSKAKELNKLITKKGKDSLFMKTYIKMNKEVTKINP